MRGRGVFLLLLGLLLGRAAQGASLTITAPANGAVNLTGIIRIQLDASPNTGSWTWNDDFHVALVDAQDQIVEQGSVCAGGDPVPPGHFARYYDLETRLHPNATYQLKAWGYANGTDPDNSDTCDATSITISTGNFPYMRHIAAGKITLRTVGNYVPTQGGSTHPIHGYQAFQVPVTSWEYKGRSFAFALTYDSSSLVDPAGVAPVEFAGLAERNGHWSHSYAQWVDLIQDDYGRVQAIWHQGNGRVLGFAWSGTGFVSRDSFHTLTSGGGPLTSPSYPWAGGTQTLTVPYGWFILKDGAGTQYQFNYNPPTGQTHLLWRTAEGAALPHYLLTRIVDRWGRTLNVTWSSGSEPRVTAAKDGGNTGVTLQYTGNLLTAVVDPQGRTHTLAYAAIPDENGTNRQKLTGVTVLGAGSPNRTTSSWSFAYRDGAAPGDAYAGTYTGDLVIQRTAPDGVVTKYGYEGVGPDRAGYDDWVGKIASITWPDSSEGSLVTRTITRTLDTSTGIWLLAGPGALNSMGYADSDFGDRTVVSDRGAIPWRERYWEWDSQHNLTAIRTAWEPAGANPLLQWAYTFDSAGRIDQVTQRVRQPDGSLGDPVETQYNDLNLPTQVKAYARSGSGNADQITRYEYDGGGTLTVGNLTKVTEAYGTAQQRESTNYYEGTDGAWGLITRRRNAVAGESSFDYHDERGWLLTSASPQNLVVGASHPDRASSVTTTAYNGDGLPSQVTDAEGHTVTITYNAAAAGSANLVTTRTFADGSYRQETSDPFGRTLETRDERGVRTVWTYNPAAQIKTITRAAGTADQRVTTNTYDERGDLAAIDPPAGSGGRIQFDYRRYNQDGTLFYLYGNPDYVQYERRLTRTQHADGTVELRGYTNTGELDWIRRADGSLITIDYDAEHRVKTIHYPAHGSQAAFTVADTFDEFGRVSSRTDNVGTTTTTFDALNRPVLVTPPSPQKAISYTYTPDTTLQRWITTVAVDGVGSYQYREDSKGRTCEVINPFSQSFWNEFDKDGKNTLTIQPNGVREERSYTARDWLAGIQHRKADSTILDTLNYYYTDASNVYDPTGRLQREVDSGGRTHAFAYDNLNELIAESHPDIGTVTYGYDLNGNRATKTTALGTEFYGVDAANKLLWVNRGTNGAPTSGQSGAYTKLTYDGNGCVTQRERRYDGGLLQTLDLYWDGDNRLREIKEGATSRFTASYNGDGLRVGKTDSWTGAHDYSWGPQGVVFDSSGSTVLTPGLAQRSGGVDRFSQEDWLGSARYLTDSTGNGAPSALRYDAFGQRMALAGPSYPTEFQFAGKWGYESEYQDGSDPGLGINYLQQRYYDPGLGRFLSRDPLGFAGGLNLYDYAGSNPVNAVDPSGEDPRQNFRNAMSLVGTGIGMVMGGFGGGAGGAAGGSLVGPVGTIGGGVAGGVEGGIEGGALGGLLGLETAEIIIRGVDWIFQATAGPAPTPEVPRVSTGSLPAEEAGAVEGTLQHIDAGTKPPWKGKWGALHKNLEGNLPHGPTYKEYYVPPPPGTAGPGPRRIVTGSDGSVYYTWNHYGQGGAKPPFVKIR